MSLARVINNLHVGKVEGTFDNDTTANEDFTQTDLDNRLYGCSMAGNNKVKMSNAADVPLLGAVVAVSLEVDSSSIPEEVVVQIAGIAEFKGAATMPTAGDRVAVNTGLVVQDATADTLLANLKSRGIVTNVHDTNYIEILL